MATETMPRESLSTPIAAPQIDWAASTSAAVRKVGEALASLRLTVVLFAMAIFIVLAGTLAQVDQDIWEIIRDYFRTPVAYIPFSIFFPPSFFGPHEPVPGGFFFPGGWLIGGLMGVNLLAAHLIRFKIQAKGTRLLWGTLVTLAGIFVTWLVIYTGENADGVDQNTHETYVWLWIAFKVAVFSGTLGAGVAVAMVPRERRVTWFLWLCVLGAMTAGSMWLAFQGSTPTDSSMRILWQLTKGALSGGLLLGGCWLLFRKRAGIVLLHAGVALMMLSELLVGVQAVESQMGLFEGETKNYTHDIRTAELAVVQHVDDKTDRVIAVPRELVVSELSSWAGSWSGSSTLELHTIDVPALPFTVKVVQYFENAELKGGPDQKSPTPPNAGIGAKGHLAPRPKSRGTDSGGGIDLPGLYADVIDRDGKSLGRYLLTTQLSDEQGDNVLTVDGKTYDLSYRFTRYYKPYRVTLTDVRREVYPGTQTPKDYSSDIHLTDPSRGVDRDVHIWMNNPLRFAGETFYQSGYNVIGSDNREVTTLSVVTNSGWMIPYVSCMIVAIGMLAQFLLVLTRFVTRAEHVPSASATAEIPADPRRRLPAGARDVAANDTSENQSAGGLKGWVWGWGLTALVVLIFGGYVLGESMPKKPKAGTYDFAGFGSIPVFSQGRSKPIDTLARNLMLSVSARSKYEEAGKSEPAIRWLLDLMARPDEAAKRPVFRIENFDVLSTLGLQNRSGFRYSFAEIREGSKSLDAQMEKIQDKPKESLTVYERKLSQFNQQLNHYFLIVSSLTIPSIHDDRLAEDFELAMRREQMISSRQPPLLIPPHAMEAGTQESKSPGDWQTFSSAAMKDLLVSKLQKRGAALSVMPDQGVRKFMTILHAWSEQSPEQFNAAVDDYHKWLVSRNLEGLDFRKLNFETYFQRVDWFTKAMVMYLAAFVLAVLSWMFWTKPLGRAAVALLIVAVIVHTGALAGRMYISGRPPVTNLYSSAVFIGWATVLLGLLLEGVYRNGIGSALAGIAGYATLLVAWGLGSDGDTLDVMQAVLDTQFWLATHVTCITLGYGTTYFAGLLGIIYILRGVLTPGLTPDLRRDLYRMIYGTLCFSILFSFVGTVLGGLWADDSWGRFWGWDPKENGALIIVLWNALTLHARWGGMVKDRGLAVLAVAGNICVSWSWFGVNELGVGLHSYGFTEGVLMWLGLFVLSQLVVIGIGLIPRKYWWSDRRSGSAQGMPA